jgi:hypothetical protein
MKKIVSFILVLLTALLMTGCGDMGTGATEDYEFCRETIVWAGPGGMNTIGMYKYETEYLKKTGCRSIETCDKTVQLTVVECQ